MRTCKPCGYHVRVRQHTRANSKLARCGALRGSPRRRVEGSASLLVRCIVRERSLQALGVVVHPLTMNFAPTREAEQFVALRVRKAVELRVDWLPPRQRQRDDVRRQHLFLCLPAQPVEARHVIDEASSSLALGARGSSRRSARRVCRGKLAGGIGPDPCRAVRARLSRRVGGHGGYPARGAGVSDRGVPLWKKAPPVGCLGIR